jgi:hypothetical protein
MTVLFATVALACVLVALLPSRLPRRSCPPAEHLVSVVAARRLRHGLRRRHWIRCPMCDLELGPYDSWHAAWTDAFRIQIEIRRGMGGHESSRLSSNGASR